MNWNLEGCIGTYSGYWAVGTISFVLETYTHTHMCVCVCVCVCNFVICVRMGTGPNLSQQANSCKVGDEPSRLVKTENISKGQINCCTLYIVGVTLLSRVKHVGVHRRHSVLL